MDYIFRRLALDFLPYETPGRAGHLHRRGAGRPAAGRGRRGDERGRRGRAVGSAPDRRQHGTGRARKPRVRAEPPPSPPRCRSKRAAVGRLVHRAAGGVIGKAADAPLCFTCGTKMRPAGSCYVCEGCGSTSGCS